MKISLNWLKEYVTLPADLTPEKLAHDLTMCTVEVEEVEHLAHQWDKVIVGRILEIGPHPKADRLKLVKVDSGAGEPLGIVCGGSNLAVGMSVPVALVGARVRWHGTGDLVTLEPATIRGVKSEGMICASNEIGLAELFPATSESEIMDLSPLAGELVLNPGTPLAQCLGLDDVVFEVDNKSLTNRPDLWGHYGIARELAAIYNQPLRELPKFELSSEVPALLKVGIKATERSSRYIGVLIDGTKDAPSPFWIRKRLSLMKQRPLSLLVDLTNYVMFAVGQPMHVFDYDKLTGQEISVRNAANGEKIKLLDGQEYALEASDLVIADAQNPVALAGVMGGEFSSVTNVSKRVLLESASFEALGIRRTASRLGLRSEASMRFEKGIDSPRARAAVDFFLNTLKSIQPEISLSATSDCYPGKPEPLSVSVTRAFIVSRIGQDVGVAEISEKLKRLGFGVHEKSEAFTLAVPCWRATGDVSLPEDIVEEVARLVGYEDIRFVPPKIELRQAVLQPEFELHREMREFLAWSAGMNEIITYPWVEDSLIEAAGFKAEDCMQLIAPPSQSCRCLQPSLIPNMLHATERNLRFLSSFGVFELANVFKRGAVYAKSGHGEKLPDQPKYLAGALVGTSPKDVLLGAKGILVGLFKRLRLFAPTFSVAGEGAPGWGAKGTVLTLECGGKMLGHLGLLATRSAQKAGIEGSAVALFEINASEMEALTSQVIRYKSIPQFPVVEFDLSMLFDVSTTWAQIERTASGLDPLIVGVTFMDEYRGEQVPEGKKSIAFKLKLVDPKATLTSEQISQASTKVIKKLESGIGAIMRAS